MAAVLEHRTLIFDPGADEAAITADVVIAVFNEQVALPESIARLHSYLADRLPFTWRITIADDASTDGTWAAACQLAQTLPGVRALHLDPKGRSRALRTAWTASNFVVVAYMDVDLSTDLDALLPLVAPLVSGHSDIAIGTRLASTARVSRGPRREAVSRTYDLILRAALHAGSSDAQCGFKAVRGDVAKALLPLVVDQGWFFDTELLVLAEHNGRRIHEVPVDWVDDPDSRMHIACTARDDLRGVWRLVRSFARGEGVLAAQLADASHELRTPLASIRGFAELFRLGGENAGLERATMVRRIEEESARMNVLVDDLLLPTRVDQTRPAERNPVDLAVLAADACTDAAAVDPSRRITLEAPEPVVVAGDSDRLRQAIGNLATNALRHTPAGTPVDVHAGLRGGRALIQVRDHGDGLSEDALTHVFDRFWRANGARRAGGGVGLGLSIVAAIAEEQQGKPVRRTPTAAALCSPSSSPSVPPEA